MKNGIKLFSITLILLFIFGCMPSQTGEIEIGEQVKPPQGYIDMKNNQ